jgi:uncharacterized membrane protein
MLYSQSFIKYLIGWVMVFIIRLIPFRAPNIEPVMATLMPFSKQYGALGAFIFGALSIAIFDVAVGKVGQWTLITGITYGAVGIASALFFRKRQSTRKNYIIFAVFGTLFYDAVTGLSIGPLFFGQPFREAFLGQIPFTLWHLLGNVSFAFLLSPALYQWIVMNPKLETEEVMKTVLARK